VSAPLTAAVLAFAAYGTPAPQGSKRHVGHGVMVESSKAVKPWREAVLHAALDALPLPWEPLDGPLAVRMVFTVARPKAARKRDVAPCRTPDLSKLARATEDAMTSAGVWADDARAQDYLRLAKVWWGFDDEALPFSGVVVAVSASANTAWLAFHRRLAAERERREVSA
jgi:Holliday junction resolvase RusA-like endonuclease